VIRASGWAVWTRCTKSSIGSGERAPVGSSTRRASRSAQATRSFSKARAAPVNDMMAMAIPAEMPLTRCVQKIIFRIMV